jgi:ribosome-binding factor A
MARKGHNQAGGGGRGPRLEAAIREELATSIPALKDPRVLAAGTVSVNLVKLNVDYRVARVFVSFLGDADEKTIDTAIEGLESASGRLRGEVGRSLGIKFTPELRFIYDRTTDAIRRIEEVVREDEEKKRE